MWYHIFPEVKIMKNIITDEELNEFESHFSLKPCYQISKRTVTKNGIFNSCIDEELVRTLKNSFSVDVNAGNVCNQKRSGRCWMFAGLNVIRTILLKTLNVKNIELSQAYLQFYDKLEKANFFMERAIDLSNEDIKSRNNVFLLDSGISDGGHFVMFTNLVKKYGVLPIEEMPDLAVSQDTTELNAILSDYLAQAMMELRTAKKKRASLKTLNDIKKSYLDEIYRILTISLGVPPKVFKYEYKDKDDKFVSLKEMTPKEFYESYIKVDLDDYICLSDAPIESMKMYTKYTSKLVNNVEGGDEVVFFNVPLKELKKATKNSLLDNAPVWFAADVSTQSLRKEGYLADGVIKSDFLFHIESKMNKGQRLTYRSSFCNHAMTFTGVNIKEDGNYDRWKVENSWGKENGKDGFYIMSDKWFDEYVYEVFVSKKYVSKTILEKYERAEKVYEEPYNTLYKEFN